MTTASSVAVGSAHSSHPSPPRVFLSVKALKAEQTENLLSFTFQSQSAVMETYSCVIVICTQHWCQTCCNNEPVTGQWSDLQSALWVCGTRVWLMFLRGRHSVMSSWRALQSSWITFHCYINITLNLHLNIQAEKFRFTFINQSDCSRWTSARINVALLKSIYITIWSCFSWLLLWFCAVEIKLN